MVYEIATYSLSKIYKTEIEDRVKRLDMIANENREFLIELSKLAKKYNFELSTRTQSEPEDVALSWGLDQKVARYLGKKGGNKTLQKYGREEMTKWGRRGGRPSKRATSTRKSS